MRLFRALVSLVSLVGLSAGAGCASGEEQPKRCQSCLDPDDPQAGGVIIDSIWGSDEGASQRVDDVTNTENKGRPFAGYHAWIERYAVDEIVETK